MHEEMTIAGRVSRVIHPATIIEKFTAPNGVCVRAVDPGSWIRIDVKPERRDAVTREHDVWVGARELYVVPSRMAEIKLRYGVEPEKCLCCGRR